MTVTSFGYPGTIDPGVTWANAQLGMGSRYWVRNYDSVRVTPRAGGDREVNISPGWFGGWGVTDYNDATAVVQLPVVASGTAWFLIVARRTWGVDEASSATTFAYVSAGSTAVIPARNDDPGELDDQPLALVSMTAGQTAPGSGPDLRAIGVGKEDFIILHELALSYLAEPGVRARLGDSQYQYGMNSGNTGHAWVVTSDAVTVASGMGNAVTNGDNGFSVAGIENTVAVRGNLVDLTFSARKHSGPPLMADGNGNFADTTIANVVSTYRPSVNVPFEAMYLGAASAGAVAHPQPCRGVIYPDGRIQLWAGTAGAHIYADSNFNVWHIWGQKTYLRHS